MQRFKDREQNPNKQWKITDEDWRNREKWDMYLEASQDMIKYEYEVSAMACDKSRS